MNSADFQSIYALIAEAVADARGDALFAERDFIATLDADPDLRAAVSGTLVSLGVRAIAEEIQRELYPRNPKIAF